MGYHIMYTRIVHTLGSLLPFSHFLSMVRFPHYHHSTCCRSQRCFAAHHSQAAYTGIAANELPRRSSIVNRPGTAASTASVMRERGTRLRVVDQKQQGRPQTSSPLAPTSALTTTAMGTEAAASPFDEKQSSSSSRSSSSSSSRGGETQLSVDTFELKHTIRAVSNGGLAIAMKQGGGLKGGRR